MTTGGPLIAHTPLYGGKYHASRNGYSAACNSTILVQPNPALDIHVQPGQTRVHPIVCLRCLLTWRRESG